MKCFYCGTYFKYNSFNHGSNVCTDCDASSDMLLDDSEMQLEIELLKNKSGRKATHIDDYNDDDSHGF